MKEGPDIAHVAALIGDPARANILTALMAGKALTASELAEEAGIAMPTASGHLRKLEEGGLVVARKQGRHKYFALAGAQAGDVLEALMGFAVAQGHLRTRTGPRDAALRAARVCYNHLAGQAGVQMYDSLVRRGYLQIGEDGLSVTEAGGIFVADLGVSIHELAGRRAPLCRECLDWSERRSHLAGVLGRALFDLLLEKRWVDREAGSRAVRFSKAGRVAFDAAFPTH